MKNIYSSPHLFLVNHYKNIVESYGIPCVVRNQFLSGAAGELPPTEVWPILCVEDDRDYDRARQIVDEELNKLENTTYQDWVCSNCGERIEGQFTDCWNCGTSRQE
ncbi:MAG: DUF2007 domain-containing protein [Gammaproteobacteria bacterium]|jgi:hypothetical protein